jgi:hypothetical protein
MEMGRSVYEQPGTEVDRILSQQGGFQVSKGKRKGTRKGKAESKGIVPQLHCSFYIHVHSDCLYCLNDCQSIHVYIIIVGYECS